MLPRHKEILILIVFWIAIWETSFQIFNFVTENLEGMDESSSRIKPEIGNNYFSVAFITTQAPPRCAFLRLLQLK